MLCPYYAECAVRTHAAWLRRGGASAERFVCVRVRAGVHARAGGRAGGRAGRLDAEGSGGVGGVGGVVREDLPLHLQRRAPLRLPRATAPRVTGAAADHRTPLEERRLERKLVSVVIE